MCDSGVFYEGIGSGVDPRVGHSWPMAGDPRVTSDGHHALAPRGRGTLNETCKFIHNSGMVVQLSLLGMFGYAES